MQNKSPPTTPAPELPAGQCCGTCRWWQAPPPPYTHGDCLAILPWDSGPRAGTYAENGSDCSCYAALAAARPAGEAEPVAPPGTARVLPDGSLGCIDCGERYGSPRFPDLLIEQEAWNKIAPNHDEGGILCPNCICARLETAGLSKVRSAFRSGPLISDGRVEDWLPRRSYKAEEAGSIPAPATVELQPGWLEKQIAETQAEVASWPAQFQIDATLAAARPAGEQVKLITDEERAILATDDAEWEPDASPPAAARTEREAVGVWLRSLGTKILSALEPFVITTGRNDQPFLLSLAPHNVEAIVLDLLQTDTHESKQRAEATIAAPAESEREPTGAGLELPDRPGVWERKGTTWLVHSMAGVGHLFGTALSGDRLYTQAISVLSKGHWHRAQPSDGEARRERALHAETLNKAYLAHDAEVRELRAQLTAATQQAAQERERVERAEAARACPAIGSLAAKAMHLESESPTDEQVRITAWLDARSAALSPTPAESEAPRG